MGQSSTANDRFGYEDSHYGSVDNTSFILGSFAYRVIGLYSGPNGSVLSLTALPEACEYLPTQLDTVSFLVAATINSRELDYANSGCHVNIGYTEDIFTGFDGEDVLVILRIIDTTPQQGSIAGQGFHGMLCSMPDNILGAGACTPVYMAVFSLFFVVIGLAVTRNPLAIGALAVGGLVGGIALTVSSPIVIALAIVIALGFPASVILIVRRG